MCSLVALVAKVSAHTEKATVLLYAGPLAHSFSHQSSSADEADQGKAGGCGGACAQFQSVFTGSRFTLGVQQLRGGSGISLRGSRRSSWLLRWGMSVLSSTWPWFCESTSIRTPQQPLYFLCLCSGGTNVILMDLFICLVLYCKSVLFVFCFVCSQRECGYHSYMLNISCEFGLLIRAVDSSIVWAHLVTSWNVWNLWRCGNLNPERGIVTDQARWRRYWTVATVK